MLLYSLIVHWFASEGHRHYRPLERPWYSQKKHASFADMLTTLRRESAREEILSLGLSGAGSRKIKHLIDPILQLAASRLNPSPFSRCQKLRNFNLLDATLLIVAIPNFLYGWRYTEQFLPIGYGVFRHPLQHQGDG